MAKTVSAEKRTSGRSAEGRRVGAWRGILGWVVMVSITEASLVAAAVTLTVIIALQAAGDHDGAAPDSAQVHALAMPAFEPVDEVKPAVGDEGAGAVD